MAGEKRKTKWCASSWAVGSPSFHPSKPGKAMDLGLAASGWMMLYARGRSSPWSPAGTGCGGTTTVPTRKMWQWSAQVSPTDLLHFQGTKEEERQLPLVVRIIPPGLQSMCAVVCAHPISSFVFLWSGRELGDGQGYIFLNTIIEHKNKRNWSMSLF